MKKIHLYVLLPLITISLMAVKCNKIDDPFFSNKPPSTSTSNLPPETTTGAGTFGCLINGMVWLPKGGGSFEQFGADYLKGSLYIFAHNVDSDDFISLRFDNSIYDTGLFLLKNANLKRGIFYVKNIHSSNIEYTADSNTNSYFKLTRLDSNNVILSGSFAFNAINGSGDTVKITQGRFDIKYKF